MLHNHTFVAETYTRELIVEIFTRLLLNECH